MIEVIRQLLVALAYLHSKRVVHADVKLENIMISSVRLNLDRESLNFVILDSHTANVKIERKKLSRANKNKL